MKPLFKKQLTIIDTLKDKHLLGQFIENLETWRAWLCLLRAFYGLPCSPDDLALYQQCTGRTIWPLIRAIELWIACGVRGGKSKMTSILAAFEAVFVKHKLSAGEKGYIIIVAPTVKQGRVIVSYLSSIFNDNDFFRPYLVRENSTEIELNNGIIINVIAADFKSIRGYTAVACIVDEIAFLEIEGATPDTEVIRSLRSRLLNTGGPLICISSPYAKRGMLYDIHKKHFGRDDSPVLVWQAGSLTMNPTLNQKAIEQAMEEDEAGGRADYLAEFRSDISSYVSREVVEGNVVTGRHALPYLEGYSYFGFCDPSGGSKDSMTLAIGHMEKETRVLDCLIEKKPPFSPDAVVKEFAETLKGYHVHTVRGDRYAGQWPQERFFVHGIAYEVSDKPKSDLFLELLPLLNSCRVELLDNEKMLTQLVNLERRTARSGKDSIDHPPHGHDDLANAAAGCLVGLAEGASNIEPYEGRASLMADMNEGYFDMFGF